MFIAGKGSQLDLFYFSGSVFLMFLLLSLGTQSFVLCMTVIFLFLFCFLLVE